MHPLQALRRFCACDARGSRAPAIFHASMHGATLALNSAMANTKSTVDDKDEKAPASKREHHSLVPASAASGAVIGAIAGAIGGPPGAAIGGVIGAAAGLIAGKVIDGEDQRQTARDAELDDEIGVTTDEIGLGATKILDVPQGDDEDEEG